MGQNISKHKFFHHMTKKNKNQIKQKTENSNNFANNISHNNNITNNLNNVNNNNNDKKRIDIDMKRDQNVINIKKIILILIV